MIKEINKLIKPYFVKIPNGGCHVLVPILKWDELVDEILFVLLRKLFNAFPVDVKGKFKTLFK